GVSARFAGMAAKAQADEAEELLGAAGLENTYAYEEDENGWGLKADLRMTTSDERIVVRVSGLQAQLADQMRAAERALNGSLVGRAAHGLSWISCDAAEIDEDVQVIDELRTRLAPSQCVVVDAPTSVRELVD